MIDVFTNVPDLSVETRSDIESSGGKSLLNSTSSIKIGSGSNAFKGDQSGIWLGSNKFEDATFSVDMDGNVYIRNGSITVDNANSDTVIDSNGIVSVNNFATKVASAESESVDNADGDVTMCETAALVLPRSTVVLVIASFRVVASGAGCSISVEIEHKKDSGAWGTLSQMYGDMDSAGHFESLNDHYTETFLIGSYYYRAIVNVDGAGTAIVSGRISAIKIGT